MNKATERRLPIVLACALLALGVSAIARPASAHHSFSMFDLERVVRIDGVIVEFQWTNPHAWAELDVTNPDGEIDRWAVEFNSPNNLTREGWNRRLLEPGDEVIFLIHPMRDGRPAGLYRQVVLDSGEVMNVVMMPGAPPEFDLETAPSPYDAP